MSERTVNWNELTIAVVAGDERECEIARLAAATGAKVRAYGFPWPEDGIVDVDHAGSAAEALRGARIALFPIPGIDHKGRLFAPASPEPIIPRRELLELMDDEAHVFLGEADQGLCRAADRLGIQLHEYESDRTLMLLRGPAICEGAIELTIKHTDVTIHASSVAVVGQGTIGSLLTRMLVGLGARTHVFARNPVQRAAAYASGAEPHELDQLPRLVDRMAMIFSTVPAPVVGRGVLERVARGSLIMDLAAPPGGVDLELARGLGHTAIWARGMGRRAPVTVGASQWYGVQERIKAALSEG